MAQILTIFKSIKGIGSASGLYWNGDILYVIGDNSGYLYAYDLKENELSKFEVLPERKHLINIPKAEKPDFEALCHFGDSLYLFGSGSTAKRNLLVDFNLTTQKVVHRDLSFLYQQIKLTCNIDDDNLNIEGAVFNGEDWLLFNRGNGNASKNGIIRLSGNHLLQPFKVEFIPILLKNKDNVVASFTDAILKGNVIYFIAAAEDTSSTYADGAILGSYIGRLNAQNLQLNYIKKISSDQKFEGITLTNSKENEFLLCEDRDNDVLETVIYKLKF